MLQVSSCFVFCHVIIYLRLTIIVTFPVHLRPPQRSNTRTTHFLHSWESRGEDKWRWQDSGRRMQDRRTEEVITQSFLLLRSDVAIWGRSWEATDCCCWELQPMMIFSRSEINKFGLTKISDSCLSCPSKRVSSLVVIDKDGIIL